MTDLTEADLKRLRGAFDDGGSVIWLALQRAVERIIDDHTVALRAQVEAVEDLLHEAATSSRHIDGHSYVLVRDLNVALTTEGRDG